MMVSRQNVLAMVVGLLVLCTAVLDAALVKMDVDLTDAGRRLYHSRLTMPVRPGKLKLNYPEWIPGEHGPTGPVTDLAGIRITSGGAQLDWWREPTDMYTLNLEVPAGAREIEIELDFIVAPPNAGSFTAAASSTSRLAVVNWNQLLFYPAGVHNDRIDYQVTLHLPDQWQAGCALPVESESPGVITFAPVTLEKLIDSPLNSGRYYRRVDITPPGAVPHYLHLVCDQAAGLEISDEQTAAFRKLTAEALALFGARHYESYHFLLTMSDYIAHFGLEHHESSDDRAPEDMLTDPDQFRLWSSLLAHEMIHSWNGKYRRPAGMATRDYHDPKVTDLLWVYEGLTHYLTSVLSTRCGLWTEEWSNQITAGYADWLVNRKGRTWRPLEDTAVSAQLLFQARKDWSAWRRGVDFYREGVLLWLEVDATIRRESGGKKSLDDFCRLFFGGTNSGPEVVPYTFEQLVAALGEVQPHDWTGLLRERIRSREQNFPLYGLELSGWKLDYAGKRSEYQATSEGKSGGADLGASLGLEVSGKGIIADVIPGTAADQAGLAPGMQIMAVNGKVFSAGQLRQAVEQAQPVRLVVENSGFYADYTLNYSGGLRFPVLVRVDGSADLLGKIMAPKTGSN